MIQSVLIAFVAFISGFVVALFLYWRRETKVPKYIRDIRKRFRESQMFIDSIPDKNH